MSSWRNGKRNRFRIYFFWIVGSSPAEDKMLSSFSKNTVSYCFLKKKKLFLLVLTSVKGWGVISCSEPYFLMKDKKVFFFLSHMKSCSTSISIIFLGFQKGYFQYLKIKGMGYKFVSTSNAILLKFGFSHRVLYLNSIDTKCDFVTRYILCLEVRSLCILKKNSFFFNSIRKKNVYKKKGIFFKGLLINIRIGSKKSKF